MDWYELVPNAEAASFYVSSMGDLAGLRWWHFAEGKTIENWTCRAWIKSTSPAKDGPPEDGLANHLGLLVFSQRMRAALENSSIDGVQYLQLRVLKSDDTEYEGYSIVNILNFPSALDLDRSDFSAFISDNPSSEDVSRISRLRKAVLKGEALGEFHVIRLKDFPEAVYVSGHFRNVYDRNTFKGYEFRRIQISLI
jgi:hypothetical protein